jgi:hypothetical protein
MYRNNELFVVKNGSELTFNVECEDYLDNYTAAGVPTGRVYQNNIYVIKDFLLKIRNKSVDSPLGLLSDRTYSSTNSDFYNTTTPQTFWVNQLNELIVDNSTGSTKSQKNYQFLWSVNYDSVTQTAATKLTENIGNNFVSINTNSVTNVLGSDEYNLGYLENSILSFIGNNNSLLDTSKWVDQTVTVASTTKLLSTIHPQVQNLDKIIETNVDKVKAIEGGESNDIDIPINIYFKMNAMDTASTGLNYQYINLNGARTTVRHIKKLKFYLQNEEENRPFIFSVKFILNRSRVVTKVSLATSPTQLISNR